MIEDRKSITRQPLDPILTSLNVAVEYDQDLTLIRLAITTLDRMQIKLEPGQQLWNLSQDLIQIL